MGDCGAAVLPAVPFVTLIDPARPPARSDLTICATSTWPVRTHALCHGSSWQTRTDRLAAQVRKAPPMCGAPYRTCGPLLKPHSRAAGAGLRVQRRGRSGPMGCATYHAISRPAIPHVVSCSAAGGAGGVAAHCWPIVESVGAQYSSYGPPLVLRTARRTRLRYPRVPHSARGGRCATEPSVALSFAK
jgi:hypothetical protein